jgi:hypothetical protein
MRNKQNVEATDDERRMLRKQVIDGKRWLACVSDFLIKRPGCDAM